MASKTKRKTKKKPPSRQSKTRSPKKAKSVKKGIRKKARKAAKAKTKKSSVKKTRKVKKKPAAKQTRAKTKKSKTKKAKTKSKVKSRKTPSPSGKPAKAKTRKAVKKPAPKKKTTGKPRGNKKLIVHKHDPSRLDPIISRIRDQLIEQRNELMKMIQSSQEVERNVGDITFSNEIDLASSLEGREMAFQLSSRERNELKMIEEALIRIKSGTYGICEGCSRPIGVKRLQIMPLTALCIECQENLEGG